MFTKTKEIANWQNKVMRVRWTMRKPLKNVWYLKFERCREKFSLQHKDINLHWSWYLSISAMLGDSRRMEFKPSNKTGLFGFLNWIERTLHELANGYSEEICFKFPWQETLKYSECDMLEFAKFGKSKTTLSRS